MPSQTDIDRYEQIQTDLYENAGYAAADSVEMAGKFLTALTRAIAMIPQMASHGGGQAEEARHDIATWEEQRTKVQGWLQSRRSRASAGFRLRGATKMRPRYQWNRGQGADEDLQAE